MKWLVAWFARNPVAANLLMLSFFVAGAASLSQMKIEIFPETQVDMVMVTVPYPGSTPSEVEEGITILIEEKLADLEGIKEMISTSAEGFARVTVEVENDKDVRDMMDDVKSRVDSIDNFPVEAEEPVIEELILRNHVLSVAVTGDLDEKSLRVVADRVRDEILSLPGISQAQLTNVRPYEIAIEISESSLRQFGLSFDDVAQAVRNTSVDLSGGLLKSGGGEILLRTEGKAYEGVEFENIVVMTRTDGSRILVKDVATVLDGFEETPISSTFDGKRAALINVYRVGDQNALDVSAIIQKYVGEAGPRMPEGVELEIWRDTSILLKQRIELLIRNAWQGLILVAITLALFLRLNVAFWVCLGIPVSFMGTFAVMPWLGVSINMISLFALILVLGIVVDDAIVIGESIYSEAQKRGHSSTQIAIQGARRVSVPVVFSVLTTVAAFFPMLNIPGVSGKIWGVIPLTVIPTLLFSLVESQLILPAHLAHANVAKPKPTLWITKAWHGFFAFFSEGLEKFVKKVYRPFLFVCTRYRYVTLTTFVMMLLLFIWIFQSGWIRFTFFPNVPADYLICRLEMPQGTPAEVTAQGIDRIQKAALQLRKEYEAKYGEDVPIFEHTLATVGNQPFVGAFAINLGSPRSHVGEVTIELASADIRPDYVRSSEIERQWRELTGQIPGAVELSFSSKLMEVGEPINVQVVGLDFEVLQKAAEEIKNHLNSYDGVVDIEDNFRDGKREIKLEIVPEAQALGLTQLNLARQVRQAFYGEEAQRVQRERDEVKVMVRYPLEGRRSIADLENMRVRTPDGREVPFANVARAELGQSFSTITRVDRKRAINVTGDVDPLKTNAQKVLGDFKENFLPGFMERYPGVQISFQGESREQAETLDGLTVGAWLAMVAIFALMAIPFKSYFKPLIIMTVIPLSVTGAIMGHAMLGMDLSMLSVCGIVALAGVAVNDGLVMVDYINQKRWAGLPLIHCVHTAGSARFRAILLTSLTTFFGLLPILAERSLQAQFLKPMAVSLGFGVMYATLLNLVLVPCLYLILEDIRHRFQKLTILPRSRKENG